MLHLDPRTASPFRKATGTRCRGHGRLKRSACQSFSPAERREILRIWIEQPTGFHLFTRTWNFLEDGPILWPLLRCERPSDNSSALGSTVTCAGFSLAPINQCRIQSGKVSRPWLYEEFGPCGRKRGGFPLSFRADVTQTRVSLTLGEIGAGVEWGTQLPRPSQRGPQTWNCGGVWCPHFPSKVTKDDGNNQSFCWAHLKDCKESHAFQAAVCWLKRSGVVFFLGRFALGVRKA